MMKDRPNLLLLFTDQQRFDTIRALGNPHMKTPHLDRLAGEGLAFTSAYTPSPECVPARCCLTFGQYPSRTRCYGNRSAMPWGEKDSLMTALGRAGYYTHGIGKCHFTPDDLAYELNGFHSRERQEELTGRPERDDYMQFLRDRGHRHITDPHGVRGELYYVPQPAQMPAEAHPTQWVGDQAVDFLRDPARGEQPWYLFSSFIHPHPPFCPPAPWHKLYRDFEVPDPKLPPDPEHLMIYINRVQNRYKRRDRGFDLHLVRMLRAYYFACVSFIDHQVGRILAALEETGQLDRTLILFTSDHGELLGDYRCFGKRSYHDAASRIPLLARLPSALPGGTCCDTPVNLLDVTATLLDVAGAEFQTHMPDGDSLLNLAGAPAADRTVFSQWAQAEHGVYTAVRRDWKYVYSAPDRRELLFDRRHDPSETRDLAGTTSGSEWPTARAQTALREALQAFLHESGETDAVDRDGWRRYPLRTMPDNPDAGMLYQDHAWADQRIPGYTD